MICDLVGGRVSIWVDDLVGDLVGDLQLVGDLVWCAAMWVGDGVGDL